MPPLALAVSAFAGASGIAAGIGAAVGALGGLSTIVGVAGLAMSAVGMVKGQRAAKKQTALMRERNATIRQGLDVQRRQAEVANARARRTAFREQRRKRAQILSQTEGFTTTAGAGALGAGQTTFAGGIAFQRGQEQFTSQVTDINKRANVFESAANVQGAKAQRYSQIAEFGQTMSGSSGRIASIFT